jgi:hypothetical protein
VSGLLAVIFTACTIKSSEKAHIEIESHQLTRCALMQRQLADLFTIWIAVMRCFDAIVATIRSAIVLLGGSEGHERAVDLADCVAATRVRLNFTNLLAA